MKMFLRPIATSKRTLNNYHSTNLRPVLNWSFFGNSTTSGPPSCCDRNSNAVQPSERQRRFLAHNVKTIGCDNRTLGETVHPGRPQQLLRYPSHNHHTVLRRTMVMVTKTQASSLPSSTTDEDGDNSNNNNDHPTAAVPPTYVNLSNSLQVTASCLNRIENLIQQRRNRGEMGNSNNGHTKNDPMYFLRVFVDAGGCSGFQYQFEMDTELDEEQDIVLVAMTTTTAADGTTSSSPRVVTDEASLSFMKGSTLDYAVEMIKSAFVVRDNPNSESACGCGSSFAVKNFSANPALD